MAISEADACGGLKLLATADSPRWRRGGRLGNLLATARNYQPHRANSLHLHNRQLHLAGGASRRTAPQAEVPVGPACGESTTSKPLRLASATASSFEISTFGGGPLGPAPSESASRASLEWWSKMDYVPPQPVWTIFRSFPWQPGNCVIASDSWRFSDSSSVVVKDLPTTPKRHRLLGACHAPLGNWYAHPGRGRTVRRDDKLNNVLFTVALRKRPVLRSPGYAVWGLFPSTDHLGVAVV